MNGISPEIYALALDSFSGKSEKDTPLVDLHSKSTESNNGVVGKVWEGMAIMIHLSVLPVEGSGWFCQRIIYWRLHTTGIVCI